MRRAITSLLTMGIGVAAYSMRDRRNRKRVQQTIQPFVNNMGLIFSGRNMRQMRKRVVKAIN